MSIDKSRDSYCYNERQKIDNFCLMNWDGIGIAINNSCIQSVMLSSDMDDHINQPLWSEISLLYLNRHFNLTQIRTPERNRVVILKRQDYHFGLYCEKVAFTDYQVKGKIAKLPVSMFSHQSPIQGLIQINEQEYFEVNFEKLYRYVTLTLMPVNQYFIKESRGVEYL
ncbi:hypothetical protein [Aliikangiella sp. IMCC44359]|uniref:hypothetical protein n=1 Tax=Aliikangiella sp. IMCC44359 TaxID=3459125 RepID=UPI00403AA3EC